MAMLEVEGWVWCDKHQAVHEETYHPRHFSVGGDCLPHHHHVMYISNPAVFQEPEVVPTPTPGSVQREDVPVGSPKGEYSGVEAEQVLDGHVRSKVTPMKVRRHTEESRKIWFDNLYEALPNDLLPADKERITEALLETTITMGNEMRRKRLIDKLRAASDEMETWDPQMNPPMADWGDLMDDAAEEIESML
jgi:hypothetical protein